MTPVAAPLDERLGYLLKAAYSGLAERIDTVLAPLELTARRLAVLSVIATTDSLSQIALGRRLGVDRTTIVEMLDDLERAGLVERRRDRRDRRRNVLGLTASGRARLVEAERVRSVAEADYLAPLTEDDARLLFASLRLLVGSGENS